MKVILVLILLCCFGCGGDPQVGEVIRYSNDPFGDGRPLSQTVLATSNQYVLFRLDFSGNCKSITNSCSYTTWKLWRR